MGNLFAELKRRHIYRVAAAYAVVAWVLLQLFNNLEPILKLPEWAGTLVLVLLLGGFPVAIFLAWVRELAPADGAAVRPTTGKLDWALMGALVVVIGIFVYQQIIPSPGARTAQQQASVAGPAPGGLSIAVLPFANMSGDAGQEFFSDGMTEEINGALAKVPDLRVVGRTSAFQFKGQSKDLRAIGQSLSARYLIEGSVRKAGAQVRIAAQLVRADDGVQLWSESYDRELTNIFAIQEDIAQAIAAALRLPLGLQQGDTLVRNRTADLESYQQYLHARALLRARGAGVSQAIAVLESVVTRDPNYAPAWALLAEAYIILPAYQQDPAFFGGSVEQGRRSVQPSLDRAEKAAQEAIRLDPRQAVGYAALGDIQNFRTKWAAGENLFKEALALDANDPDILQRYSIMLVDLGRLKDSLSMRETLRTLEPFVPIYNVTTALLMQLTGQSQATIPLLEPIPPDAAGGFLRNVRLARAYAVAGRYNDAADTLLLITGNQVSRKSVEDAARLLRRAPTKVVEPLPYLPDEMNFVYAYVGAPNRVLDNPERFVEIGNASSNPGRALWLPLYASVRKTERFKAYVRKAGLVDYWRAARLARPLPPHGRRRFRLRLEKRLSSRPSSALALREPGPTRTISPWVPDSR